MVQFLIYQVIVQLKFLLCWATGAKAIAFGPLHPAERGWLQCMKNMELCVEEAAVTGIMVWHYRRSF